MWCQVINLLVSFHLLCDDIFLFHTNKNIDYSVLISVKTRRAWSVLCVFVVYWFVVWPLTSSLSSHGVRPLHCLPVSVCLYVKRWPGSCHPFFPPLTSKRRPSVRTVSADRWRIYGPRSSFPGLSASNPPFSWKWRRLLLWEDLTGAAVISECKSTEDEGRGVCVCVCVVQRYYLHDILVISDPDSS